NYLNGFTLLPGTIDNAKNELITSYKQLDNKDCGLLNTIYSMTANIILNGWQVPFTFNLPKYTSLKCEEEVSDDTIQAISARFNPDIFFPYVVGTFDDPYQVIKNFDISLEGDYFKNGSNYLEGLTFDTDSEAELYFKTPSGEIKHKIIAKDYADSTSPVTFEIVVKKDSIAEAVPTPSELVLKTTISNFTCSGTDTECLYPLPGQPRYFIKNLHPDLYDLYYVLGSTPDKEFYIPPIGAYFYEPGNLKAKRVSQQVLFHTETNPEDDLPVSKFYGCQPASFIKTNLPRGFDGYQEKGYCTNLGDYYCSYGDSKNGYTTVNTWSTNILEEVGYTELSEDISPDDLNLQLRLAGEGENTIADRNFSARMTPGLNILPNANFIKTAGRDIYFWEFYKSSDLSEEKIVNELAPETGITRTVVTSDTEETIKQITLPANTIMVSDKLSVLEGETYQLSHQGTCQKVRIDVYNSEGTTDNPYQYVESEEKKTSLKVLSQSGKTPSYLTVTFSGDSDCTIYKPILQILDGTPAPYNFKSQYNEAKNPRAATSCCPQDYCWNGYACVAPMTDSVLTEVPGNGNYYRCVDGLWYDLPLLTDWNGEKQGFCQQDDQCFVLSTNSDFTDNNIIARATTEDDSEDIKNFHAQTGPVSFPQCINKDEYIMDHYCGQNNQWTSRTKFLANELLKYPGRSDFALYCTNPYDALVEFDNKEDPYIYGAGGGSVILSSPLGTSTTTSTAGSTDSTDSSSKTNN
ncbi:MAG: hypothetical protein ABIH82_04710, partial [Candidatus Woesearchaeota archaeon]